MLHAGVWRVAGVDITLVCWWSSGFGGTSWKGKERGKGERATGLEPMQIGSYSPGFVALIFARKWIRVRDGG